MVFGGDTLIKIFQELAIKNVYPTSEILPGTPTLNVDNLAIGFVSKAGGFGPNDIIPKIIMSFQRNN